MRPIPWLLALAGLALTRQRAEACSPPPCWPAAFVPAGEGARIPASAPGLFWQATTAFDGTETDPSKIVLTVAGDPTPLPFTATPLGNTDFLIVPDQPLIEGTTYVLTDTTVCQTTGEVGPTTTFEVGPAAALPGDLGTLSATESSVATLAVGTAAGSCSIEAPAARAEVVLAPSAEAEPWLDLLHFVTLVDGQPFRATASINLPVPPGQSWRGRGRDLIYALCDNPDALAFEGVAPGSHVVTLQASLPGTEHVVMSSSVTIDLDCTPPDDDEPQDDDDDSGSEGGCSSAGAPGLALAWLAYLLRRHRRSTPRTARA